MLPPISIAAVLQLLGFTLALYTIFNEFNTKITLDDNVLSQKEIDAEVLAKKLDGTPIKPQEYQHDIRIRRSLLVIISAFALALNISHIAYTAAYESSSLKSSLHSTWPTLCDSLIWILTIYLAFDGMIGVHLWFSVVTISYLLAIVFLSDLALLIIPQAIKTNPSSLPIHFGIAFIALLIAFTTTSGPRHVITTPEGTFHLAPVGQKGRSVVSIMYFTSAFPLIRAAQSKGQIDETDVSILGSDMGANVLYLRFSNLYEKARTLGTPTWIPTETLRVCWPLLSTIILANKFLFINVVFWSAVAAFTFYAPAFVTFQLVSFLEKQEQAGTELSGRERLRLGLPYCVLLAASMFLPTMMMGQVVTICMQWLRNRLRIQLNTAIFAKSLRRKDASGKTSNGTDEADDKESGSASKSQIVNLASVDSERISTCHYVITFGMAPAEILIGGFFSVKLLGWGAVIGLSTSILLQPIIFFLGKLEASYNSTQQSTRDRKTSLLNEVLQAIRMIKFNAWESQTSARIQTVRKEELKSQRILFLLNVAQIFISSATPIIVILVSYGWLTLVEKKPLTPAVAFTAMAVLQEMRFALSNLPDSVSLTIRALVSVRRIQEYLESEEVEIPQLGQKKGVGLKNASIQWPKMGSTKGTDEATFSLQSIDVKFTNDALNLVVGKIGSGKTLLLRALLGEADVVQGSVFCPRSLPSSIGEVCPKTEQGWLREDQCCYVPQTAFLINASVKDNILFGLPLLESRYQSTLDACGLLPDLKLLEDGDETEIGENGIGLSGGQKIRVTLARAAYGRGATVLLDDCLSAVDAHTADHIYKNLLQGPLFARRTIILVTHQVQLVAQSADKIVMLEDGKVRFQGESSMFLNSDLYNGLIEDQQESSENKEKVVEVELLSEDVTPATTAPPSPESSPKNLPEEDVKIKATPRKLVAKEERAKGAVLMSIYAKYISAMGGFAYVILVLISFVLANAFSIVTSRWLQYWSSDALADRQSHTNLWWIAIWAALWATDLTLVVLKNLFLYYGSLCASEKLFMAMLNAVLHAPLRFHDTVSRGRLLNRFSSDFAEADSTIADAFQGVGDQVIVTLASISVVTSGSGSIFIIAIALMSPIYILVGRLYMIAARDMKRLASTSKSPIISTFSDVISGVSVIRAFGASDYFFSSLAQRIEFNVTFMYWANSLRWWYEQIFTALSFCLILIAAVIILLNPSIGAARAGFVFSLLTQVHHHLLFLLQAYSNMEQSLVSVERIVEYTQLESEVEEKPVPVPAVWPSSGAVEIQNLRIRYAEELQDVIKGITVSIPGGARVGVVGPTGCGKSTLASSFFRFVKTSSGSISIDDVDIQTISLRDLRSRLQIVPQDPIILSGTLRSSVDVQNEFTDEQVRQALRGVHLLKESLAGDATPSSQSNMRDLQYNITEGGGNLSNGEKQLLCLARAILRRAKLIIFDEATSSVDFDTDQAISQTIQNAFKNSTIITIAHRLRTIINYDLVMVMDDGKVVEFDSPVKLLGDSSTRFYKLCKASGKRELAHLKSMAGL